MHAWRFGTGAHGAEDLLQETSFEPLRHRGYVRSPEGFVQCSADGVCGSAVSLGSAAKY